MNKFRIIENTIAFVKETLKDADRLGAIGIARF
jgi:hypothetical protein